MSDLNSGRLRARASKASRRKNAVPSTLKPEASAIRRARLSSRRMLASFIVPARCSTLRSPSPSSGRKEGGGALFLREAFPDSRSSWTAGSVRGSFVVPRSTSRRTAEGTNTGARRSKRGMRPSCPRKIRGEVSTMSPATLFHPGLDTLEFSFRSFFVRQIGQAAPLELVQELGVAHSRPVLCSPGAQVSLNILRYGFINEFRAGSLVDGAAQQRRSVGVQGTSHAVQ